jgi:hypothetical protein
MNIHKKSVELQCIAAVGAIAEKARVFEGGVRGIEVVDLAFHRPKRFAGMKIYGTNADRGGLKEISTHRAPCLMRVCVDSRVFRAARDRDDCRSTRREVAKGEESHFTSGGAICAFVV